MKDAPNSNGAKKQKLDESPSNDETKECPPYASQEYWEERYRKNRRLEEKTQEDDASDNSDSDALPYHPWYFTFQELSPLILPLILGGRDEGVDLMGGCRKEDLEESKGDETIEDDEVKQDDSEQGDSSSDVSEQNGYDQSNAESDDEEGKEMEEREGLAKNGPISIIEIGCGDMPLGRDLSFELAMLEETTGARADNVVKEIACCDYSPTVIDLCKENQRRLLQSAVDSHDKGSATKCVAVDYVIADARKLPYADCSFHLVMEKGTLDAMLSDKETGASNCTLIMTDCARVLKEDGYIILVSHLNAHTKNGINWLNTVVITGLRNGGGQFSTWEIEVHGSDGTKVFDEEEEVESGDEEESGEENGEVESRERTPPAAAFGGEEGGAPAEAGEASDKGNNQDSAQPVSSGPPSGSPGPAVYIIHNLSKSAETDWKGDDDDSPPVALKFFSY